MIPTGMNDAANIPAIPAPPDFGLGVVDCVQTGLRSWVGWEATSQRCGARTLLNRLIQYSVNRGPRYSFLDHPRRRSVSWRVPKVLSRENKVSGSFANPA
jgi:hypothetical protein